MNTTWIDGINARRRSPVRMAILLAALMLGHALAKPRAAHAQEADDWHGADGWFAVTLIEAPLLAGPTLSLWRLGDRPELVPYASVLLAAGSGVTWMRHARGLDPAAPLVMHGVVWGQLEGLLVGAMIDGRSHESGLRGVEMSRRARMQITLWCMAGGIAIGSAIGMASTRIDSDTAQPPAMQAPAAMLRLPPIQF